RARSATYRHRDALERVLEALHEAFGALRSRCRCDDGKFAPPEVTDHVRGARGTCERDAQMLTDALGQRLGRLSGLDGVIDHRRARATGQWPADTKGFSAGLPRPARHSSEVVQSRGLVEEAFLLGSI